MSSKATKVRLVRCPKCWGILPELADIPVYKCGGCNATLKAKNRKVDVKSVSSETLDYSPSLKDESKHDSKIKDLDSCSQKADDVKSVSSETLDYSPSLKDESKHDSKIKDLDSCSQKADLSPGDAYEQNIESEEYHGKQCKNRPSHEISSSGEINCHEKEESSSEARSRKAEHDNGGYCNSGSQSPDKQVFSRGSSPVYTAQRPYGEMLSQINNSFSNKESETSTKTVSHDPNHIRSRDAMQSAEHTNYITSDEDMDESKLSVRLRDVSKSSATRNSNAYDGSVSSYDGWDDLASDQHPYLHKRPSLESQRVPEFISNEGRSTKEDFRVKNKMDINIKEKSQARKFSSMSLNEKHDPATTGDTLLEPVRYDIQARQQLNSQGSEGFHQAPHYKGLESNKFLSEHFYQTYNSADYDHVGPSKYQQREFLCRSSLYSPEKLEYDECNQMELLRKVDELRDQLNRSYAHQRKTKEDFLARCTQLEEQRPFYHNHKLRDQENLQHYNSSYSQLPPGAFRPRKSMTGSCGSQMSFSRVGTNCIHHADYSHSYGSHEDWQCHHKLEPPSISHEGGLHRARPGHMCSDPYRSSAASPHRQVDSNFSVRCCERQSTQPCHHISRDIDSKVEKLYHKERRRTLKRHYRPIAGGAPFIICYSCSELLHVPADFLLTSKRCHRLQCGSCSKVIMFSLHKRIHIVPYSPKSVAPPPSEVDYSDAAKYCPQGDPMSYSEDYVLSTGKSCSTESEPAFLSTFDRTQASSSYTKVTEEKKKRSNLSLSGDRHKSPIEMNKFVGLPSNEAKLSFGTEMGPQTGSPLHRLMGYSSPSEMINRLVL